MNWFPLNITIIYLFLTLLLFAAGPISFHVAQPLLFYCLMLMYLLAIVLGYVVGLGLSNKITTKKSSLLDNFSQNKRLLIFIVIVALIASSITLKLNSFFNLFNPKFLWDTVFLSLSNLQSRYILKMETVKLGQSNKIMNIFLFFLSPFKMLFVSVVILFWSKIRLALKIICLWTIFIIYIFPAFNTGTNKPIFDLLIFASISLIASRVKKKELKGNSAKNKIIIVIFLILVVGAFTFFSINIQSRAGASTYIETTSPLNDIKVRSKYRDGGSALQELYVWFVGYLVQGYYGFSLSLQEDFTPTFGFGSSIFLARQVQDFFGINLFPRTYQSKISENWDESAQWHSFYSYVANDFYFLGVAIVCFLIGLFLALIWVTFLYQSNFWAFLMLPILGLLIVFIPANNQVFGFLESFSSFVFVFIGWLRSVKIEVVNNEKK